MLDSWKIIVYNLTERLVGGMVQMPKGDSINTIKKILQAAEELFSEKGFNGTSVNMIAQKAEVNKALIYYYFKDKNDIMISLLKNILKESDEYIGRVSDRDSTHMSRQEKIKKEIAFLSERKNIISVMLMESLKGENKDNYTLQIFENVINEHIKLAKNGYEKENSLEMQRYLVYEFFTGFIPLIAFIVFQDKWCEYYQCDSRELMELFWDSFSKTHLASNIRAKTPAE